LEELRNSYSILFDNDEIDKQINTDRLSFEDQKEDEPFIDPNKFDFMINSDRDNITKDEYKEAQNVKNPIQYEEVVQDDNSDN